MGVPPGAAPAAPPRSKGPEVEWFAAFLPLMAASAGTAVFFLAGRSPRRETTAGPTSAPPELRSGGPQTLPTPQSDRESFFPDEMVTIIPIWQTRRHGPSAAAPSSLPTRDLIRPRTSFGTRFWVDEPTSELPKAKRAETKSEPGDLPPIWSSHWGSSSRVKWLNGSDTRPLQRVSGAAPLAIAAPPASSDSLAASLERLCSTSATDSSNGRSSRRNVRNNEVRPGPGYLPPWAR